MSRHSVKAFGVTRRMTLLGYKRTPVPILTPDTPFEPPLTPICPVDVQATKNSVSVIRINIFIRPLQSKEYIIDHNTD